MKRSQSFLTYECELHPGEKIKYYCRDDKIALCPDCVVEHKKHDFVFADSTAALEVKHSLSTLQAAIESKQSQYTLILNET